MRPPSPTSPPVCLRSQLLTYSTDPSLRKCILDELAEIFHHKASAGHLTLDQSFALLEPCREKTDRFMGALERGDLVQFAFPVKSSVIQAKLKGFGRSRRCEQTPKPS